MKLKMSELSRQSVRKIIDINAGVQNQCLLWHGIIIINNWRNYEKFLKILEILSYKAML